MKEYIPPKYNPYLHIALIPLNSCILISLFVYLLTPISALQLLTIPITLFLMFGFEWWVHKNILHYKSIKDLRTKIFENFIFFLRKRLDYQQLSRTIIPIQQIPQSSKVLFYLDQEKSLKQKFLDLFSLKTHVDKVILKINSLHLQHHYVFTDEKMQLTGIQQLYLVLMPYWSVIPVVLFLIPLFGLLYLILGLNVACLFMITSLSFYIVYEAMHLTYHLYTGNNKIILYLQQHHKEHHNLNQMNYNFNVTIPLFDKFMKTYLRK